MYDTLLQQKNAVMFDDKDSDNSKENFNVVGKVTFTGFTQTNIN
jgi:glycerate-2-kinase